MVATLTVFHRGTVVFESEARWLYPLFELEAWLSTAEADPAELELHDRIIGTGAAFLIVRLGFRSISTPIITRRAQAIFETYRLRITADTLIDRISCSTEALLDDVTDPEAAYRAIRARVERPRSRGALLSVDDLSVRLGSARVLRSIFLEIDPGRLFLIRGENGAGKTTLLRALAGLLPAASGRVQGAAPAYLPQQARITRLPVSAQEVVLMGTAGRRMSAGDRKSAVDEALAAVDAGHLKDRRYRELSGGERRRIDLARALAQGARLLLLDEPTAGLDAASRAGFLKLLEGLGPRRSVVMVTHDVDPGELPNADWYEIHHGVLLKS